MGAYIISIGDNMEVVTAAMSTVKPQRKGSYFEFPKEFADKLEALATDRGHPKIRVLMDVFNAGLNPKPALSEGLLRALEAIVRFFSDCLEQGDWSESFSDYAKERKAGDAIEIIETMLNEQGGK